MIEADDPWPPRIFHGPVNVGGLGGYLARWQRARGAEADFVVYRANPRRDNHDIEVGLGEGGRVRDWAAMLRTLRWALPRYDLFHFYYGRSLLPHNLDLPLLKMRGKRIVMTYCGSDIRLREVEQRRHPYYDRVERAYADGRSDASKRRMMWWQARWVDRFTAPRNLYAYAAEVIPEDRIVGDLWVNNTLDLDAIEPRIETSDPPTVLHAPTRPGLKGTEHVERVVEMLEEQGLDFEYRTVSDVPHEEFLDLLRDEVDIVVDQVLMGGFGSLTMEAMAHGKPVCCFVLDEVMAEVPGCPVVNVTVDTLADRLAWLIEHPKERERLGREGRAFAEEHFDRDLIFGRVWDLYRDLMEGAS